MMTIVPRRALRFLLILFVIAVFAVWAYGKITIRLGFLEGNGWAARGITLELNWRDYSPFGLRVAAAQLELPVIKILRNVELSCVRLRIKTDRLDCRKGNTRVADPRIDDTSFKTDFTYRYRDNVLDYTLYDVAVAGGSLQLTGRSDALGWQLDLEARDWVAARLPALLENLAPLPGLDGEAKLSYTAQLAGPEEELGHAAITAELRGQNLATTDGSLAAENLRIVIQVDAKTVNGNMQLEGALVLHKGQIYVEPVFLEVRDRPVDLRVAATWYREKDALELNRVTINHPGVMQVRGSARFDLASTPRFDTFRAELVDAHLPAFYNTYLRPFLIGTALDDLETRGRLGLLVDHKGKQAKAARLELRDVYLDDRRGRFGLYGTTGDLHWRSHGQARRSRLSWDGGHVYKVGIGAGHLTGDASGQSFRLSDGTEIPVLDGRLVIDRFNVTQFTGLNARWRFAGSLAPVSMETLTQALGWPIMSGTLSGEIPMVSYADGVLELAGELRAHAFDGEMIVRNMRFEQPFGIVPQLAADIELFNLDLNTLTRTFSFGNIQGRLSGHINRLLLLNWEPVQFEAEFMTPPDDHTRHRISQKAVDNLTSLAGGGLGNAFSKGALRMFKEFSYSRLGLRCRLRNNVCEMGGVAPAQNGYYIVKGGGLPRINVIGHTKRVDWPVLLKRLKRIGQQGRSTSNETSTGSRPPNHERETNLRTKP